jgi:glycosyltransferase 2 family protein
MSVLRPLLAHPRTWTVVRWAAGIGVLALLVVSLDSGEILARIGSANGLLVMVGVLGLSAVHVMAAGAWRVLCRQLGGLQLAWATCLRVYYAAQALGGVTPANMGGDAYRVVVLRNAGLGWGAAVAPVLVQRATSYLALALLALPALAWLAISSDLPIALQGAGLLLCALAGGVSLLLLAAPAQLDAIRAHLPWRRAFEAGTASPAGTAMRPPIGSVAVATGFALAFHATSVVLTALLVVAVDPTAVGLSVLAAIVVARLSLAVPILPSGLGANEAILSLLFAGLGLAPQTALAALLLTRVALLMTTALGAGLLLVGRPGIPRRAADSVSVTASAERA